MTVFSSPSSNFMETKLWRPISPFLCQCYSNVVAMINYFLARLQHASHIVLKFLSASSLPIVILQVRSDSDLFLHFYDSVS